MNILTCSLCSAVILITSSGVVAQSLDEVDSLKASYQRHRQEAIDRVSKPLDETYVAKLKEIKERWTKAGRLDEALRIDAILDEIELREKLAGEWQWGDGGKRNLVISSDQTAILSSDEDKAAWVVLGPRKIRLFFVHTSYTIIFDDEMKTGAAERRDGVKAVIRRSN